MDTFLKSLQLPVTLLFFLLASCATPDYFRMEQQDDLLLFSQPSLTLRLKKDILSIEDDESKKTVIFQDDNGSPLFLEFFQKPSVNTLQYYYDLEYIAISNNLLYVGPVYFNDNEWAKVIHVDPDGFLLYGYITLQDNFFIYVYMVEGLTEYGKQSFMHYQNTRKMPDKAMGFINTRFTNLQEFIEIR